jgi:hypothetical protein
MKNKNPDKELLEKHYGMVLRYHRTTFKLTELSSMGGFYLKALETTQHCREGDSQWVNRSTLVKLIRKQMSGL